MTDTEPAQQPDALVQASIDAGEVTTPWDAPTQRTDLADAPTIALPPPKAQVAQEGRPASAAPAVPALIIPATPEPEAGAAGGEDDDPTAPVPPLARWQDQPGVIYQGDVLTEPTVPTRQDLPQLSWPSTCPLCGGVIDQDGYCTQCGARAKSPRDHYTEAPYPWAGGTCDIGLYHRRNEDALAILASPVPGERAALVVCDGVTTSTDSDVASLAGARAACRVLYGTRPEGLDGLEDSHSAAMMKVLRDAVRAADEAVIEATAPDSLNPASATFAAALVERTTIYWANLGDSRVYWFPDAGSPVQLSQDHSLAQVQIDEGVKREDAEASVFAHTITKWLGRDAVDPDPALGELEIQGPGWLLVCSDGLWNYASGAGDLGAVLRAITDGDQPETVPLGISGRLVDWANAQGGHDNITAAVARLEVPDPAEI